MFVEFAWVCVMMLEIKLSPLNFRLDQIIVASSSSPARGADSLAPTLPIRARVECRSRASLPVASLAESEFARLFGRSVVRCGTGGIIYNGFSKPNYPTRRSMGRFAPSLNHSAYVMIPAAGELPRDVFVRTLGAIIIGTKNIRSVGSGGRGIYLSISG